MEDINKPTEETPEQNNSQEPAKCDKCGGEITEGHVCPAPEAPAEEATNQTPEGVQAPTKKSNILMYVVIAVVVIAIAGGAYFVLSGSSSDKSQIPSTKSQTNSNTQKSNTKTTNDKKTESDSKDSKTTDISPAIPKATTEDTSDSKTTDKKSTDTSSTIYKNDKYGFQITFPAKYKVLNDTKNLYGWPKALVLLHQGGQAYDIVIEVWDTEAEYKKKYKDRLSELSAKWISGKYITILNNTKNTDFKSIVASFKAVK